MLKLGNLPIKCPVPQKARTWLTARAADTVRTWERFVFMFLDIQRGLKKKDKTQAVPVIFDKKSVDRRALHLPLGNY